MNDKVIENQKPLNSAESNLESSKVLYNVALYCNLQNMCSINLIQKHFRYGFNRTCNIIETLEELGVVSAKNGTNGREVLVQVSDLERIFSNLDKKIMDDKEIGTQTPMNSAELNLESPEVLYNVAIYCILQNMCSINLIQNHFQYGFNRTSNIVERLEELGVVSSKNGTKGREVLVQVSDLERIFNNGE